MARQQFVCAHELRVRWAEVDMQKIVFNAHYFTYIDTTVFEYFRAIGLAYPEGYVDRYGTDLYLRRTTLEYLQSARYDDVLTILCRVVKLGRSSMTFAFEIYRKDENTPLITAELVYVNASPVSKKSAPLPDDLRDRVSRYERTAPET